MGKIINAIKFWWIIKISEIEDDDSFDTTVRVLQKIHFFFIFMSIIIMTFIKSFGITLIILIFFLIMEIFFYILKNAVISCYKIAKPDPKYIIKDIDKVVDEIKEEFKL